MQFITRLLLCTCLALGCSSAFAQIYTCKGADGTRTFSDKPCGPDATTTRGEPAIKPAAPTAANPGASPQGPPHGGGPSRDMTADALKDLERRCSAGDKPACGSLERIGQPGTPESHQRDLEEECAEGSVLACERRYCDEGVTAECRAQLERFGRAAGAQWLESGERTRNTDGGTIVRILCFTSPKSALPLKTLFCYGPSDKLECIHPATRGPADPAPSRASLTTVADQICQGR